ncbi:MAG: hypothetical protein FWC15_08625 [Fibromonadales bacterium]|nr:hypothetical protein [Fibromonadales bacterium]
MQKAYFLAASVFYVVIFGLRVFEATEIAKFCIPAFVLTTALYSFMNAKDRSFKQGSLLLTLALALAFCADTVINFFPDFAAHHLKSVHVWHSCLHGITGFDALESAMPVQ